MHLLKKLFEEIGNSISWARTGRQRVASAPAERGFYAG